MCVLGNAGECVCMRDALVLCRGMYRYLTCTHTDTHSNYSQLHLKICTYIDTFHRELTMLIDCVSVCLMRISVQCVGEGFGEGGTLSTFLSVLHLLFFGQEPLSIAV